MSELTHKRAFEKRGRGRPKKGEIIVRPLTVHNWDKIKPEKRMAYVRETIQTANALYARYDRPYPNPLNIDEKDLIPESRACWEYIFSQREDGVHVKNKFGTRQAINTEETLFAFQCYVDWIRKCNFVRGFTRPDGENGVMPIIPNQSNFAKWLGVDFRLISKAVSNDPEARHTYKRILADCLSEGAMVGAYNTASTIFTLKNMCDWADKYEDRSSNKADDLGVEEAQELMKQLGYSRERATLSPPKLEGEADG